MVDPRQVADQLLVAERERKEIPPFTEAHADLDADTAYEAQRILVRARTDRGESIVGARVGFDAARQPFYGTLTSGMLLPYGQPVNLGSLIQPHAEPELAFLLARELRAPASVASVLAATDIVVAAVDVVDSRYQDFRFALPDAVADNGNAGRVVLGSQPRHPAELEDLRLVGCVLRAAGDVVATAAGAAAMGHPAAAVAWLVDRLAARGEHLAAGSLVLSGALTAAIPVRAGRAVTAEFDGLGTIEVFA